jgi:hypothetical protein
LDFPYQFLNSTPISGSVIVMDYIKECATTAHNRLDWLLELEGSPFTLNTHCFTEYKDKFMEYYRGLANLSEKSDLASALVTGSLEAAGDAVRKGIPEALAALAKAGLRELATRDLAKLLVRNKDERALEVMAEVHAYYESKYNKIISQGYHQLTTLSLYAVAARRFIDNVP